MKIVIAGGTGFLGLALSQYFKNNEHEVTILSRSTNHENTVHWDGVNLDPWTKELEGATALINLCGKSVDCRYTPQNKKEIIQSRLTSTQTLIKAVNKASNPPAVFINASSATIYVHAEKHTMTESDCIVGDDFSMNVCKEWERIFFENELNTTRQVAIRTSIVLGKGGGAFPKLKWTALLGLGGKHGNGNQKVSWIHIEDFCKSIDFIIENKHIEGPINITAPNPISNNKFMTALRKSLSIPFGIPLGKLALEFGSFLARTETELLLKSRWVLPKRLLENNFEFTHPTIESTFDSL